MPAAIVGVGCHTGKPLSYFVDKIAILREKFIATSSPYELCVNDVVGPGYGKTHGFACAKGGGQVDTHHGLDHLMLQPLSGGILYTVNGCVPLERFPFKQGPERSELQAFQIRSQLSEMAIGVLGEKIRINLDPEIIEVIRAVVLVVDHLRTHDALKLIVELHLDVVIGFLLPVGFSRCP